MTFHLRDVRSEELLSVVEAIHRAGLDPAGWEPALERLRRLLGLPYAAYMIRSDDHSRRRGVAAGVSQDDYQAMLDGFFAKSVYFRRPYPLFAGQLAESRHMAPRREVLDSEIYQGWNQGHDVHEMLRLCLRSEGGLAEVVTLARPWSAGPFGEDDLALGRMMMPHLRTAATVADRLRGADLSASGALGALDHLQQAVVMLDAAGRLFHANGPADRLLSQAGMLDAPGGVLQAPLAADTPALHRAVAQALGTGGRGPRGATVRLHKRDGSTPLAVVVVPVIAELDWAVLHRPAATVFVTDPDRSATPAVAQLRELFDLTGAEARLAADLLAGHEPREIAERQNRSINTVRTHIARLMAKTGVNRQSRLMTLLASLPRTP